MIPHEFMRRLIRVEEGLRFGEFEGRLRTVEERIRLVGSDLSRGKKVAPPYNPPTPVLTCQIKPVGGIQYNCGLPKIDLNMTVGGDLYPAYASTSLRFRSGRLRYYVSSDSAPRDVSPFWWSDEYSMGDAFNERRHAVFCDGVIKQAFWVRVNDGPDGSIFTDDGTDVTFRNYTPHSLTPTPQALYAEWNPSSTCDPFDLVYTTVVSGVVYYYFNVHE